MSEHSESDPDRAAKDYSDRLARTDQVFAPLYRQVISWLEIGSSLRVLDAGCGAGGMTELLAQAVGSHGILIANDIATAHLRVLQERLIDSELANRITYLESSVDSLPLENASVDLVWCSHVVHGQPDPLQTLSELRRVLRPGGRLVLREDHFLSRILPLETAGAGLEERIRAAERADFLAWQHELLGTQSDLPGWIALMQQAGFHGVSARSFNLDLIQPLEEDQRDYLNAILQSWRDDKAIQQVLSLEERTTLERYANPNDQAFVLNRSDLHFIHCSSVYLGSA